MKKKNIIFIFPPRHLNDKEYYFRVKQEMELLERIYFVDVIEIKNSRKINNIRKIILFFFMLPEFIKKIKNSDCVILYPSYTNYLFAPICKILGKKIILDHFVTSVYNFELTDKWYKLFFKTFDYYLYKFPDMVLTHTISMKQLLISFYGINKNKIKVIYSCLDTNLFSPTQKDQKLLNKLRVSNKQKIVIYSGLFHPFHGVKTILETIAKFQNKNVVFLIIGRKLKSNHKNIISLKAVSYKNYPKYLRLGDIWLGGIGKGVQKNRALSSNMLAAMACGLPVITSNSNENSKIINNKYNGILIEEDNSKILAIEINKLLENDKIRIKMGENARTTVINNFSLKYMEKTLYNVV